MTIITYKDFPALREQHKSDKLVICSGSFDLVHAGHVLFFEDCKELGNKLVTIVAGDKITKKVRGEDRPILNEHVRLKMIDSLKPVDYVVLDDFSHNQDNDLYAIELAIEQLHPDVYVINSDTFDIPYRQALCNKHGLELQILKRTCPKEFDNISTTKIIEKIRGYR